MVDKKMETRRRRAKRRTLPPKRTPREDRDDAIVFFFGSSNLKEKAKSKKGLGMEKDWKFDQNFEKEN